ncbi:MAG: biotin--[acetyl-CoA-carboxylase] ligase [Lachnospiraceae bacterium]|nr:biotin--[acetyl-CoA-carboxylase] ligase [Lachnospiraceae bacterium]
MKTQILELLKSSEDYVSGQELCDRFGVSRTAVWKVINKLKQEGYGIESVQSKGYRLVGKQDVLSAEEITGELATRWIARPTFFLPTVTSTNVIAKSRLEDGEKSGLLVVADEQTGGRGRRGRQWLSPKGEAIYMTLALRPEIAPGKASMLTLVMAYAVCSAIRDVTGLDARIKWPNDIVVGSRKVCGILTEMNAEPDYIHSLVIVVGINANQTRFDEAIREVATSLRMEVGDSVRRVPIVTKTMEHFENVYEEFLRCQNLSFMRDDYNRMLANPGREVVVHEPAGQYEGIAEGINDEGELLVKRPDGGRTQVYAGVVSVRGLYGYV